MAALIRTWLLFLRRLNEPLGVDYDTCAKPMNRQRWLSVRVLQIGGELLSGLRLHGCISCTVHAVLPTLLDPHPVLVEQRKQREEKVYASPRVSLLLVTPSLCVPRLSFDRFHRSVVPADPIDVESDGRCRFE